MRAFEGAGGKKIFIQRLYPSRDVGTRQSGISPSVVRIEGDGAIEEPSRFVRSPTLNDQTTSH